MSRKIIFWGGTGQAKVLQELVSKDFDLVAVFDNSLEIPPPFHDVQLHRKMSSLVEWLKRQAPEPIWFLVAIGGSLGKVRLQIHDELEAMGLISATAIHQTSFVAPSSKIGAGSQILANSSVCVDAKLGRSCIINTSSSVDHECELGDGVHIAPGAHLAGLVRVGDCSMIGTGASVLPRINIGRNVIIGAGSVVTHDVPDDVIAYGNPVRIIRKNI